MVRSRQKLDSNPGSLDFHCFYLRLESLPLRTGAGDLCNWDPALQFPMQHSLPMCSLPGFWKLLNSILYQLFK